MTFNFCVVEAVLRRDILYVWFESHASCLIESKYMALLPFGLEPLEYEARYIVLSLGYWWWLLHVLTMFVCGKRLAGKAAIALGKGLRACDRWGGVNPPMLDQPVKYVVVLLSLHGGVHPACLVEQAAQGFIDGVQDRS